MLPVIVTKSTCSGGTVVASPTSHRTRSAPGLRRATSTEAAAGSIPVTSFPLRARRHAKVPVPHPMSRDRSDPAPVDQGEVGVEVAPVRIEGIVDVDESGLIEDRIGHETVSLARQRGLDRAGATLRAGRGTARALDGRLGWCEPREKLNAMSDKLRLLGKYG